MALPIVLDNLRDPVLDTIAALAVDMGPYGHFRPKPGEAPSFWGSIEACLALYTVNVINYLPPESKAEMVEVINGYQEESGDYKQQNYDPFYAMAMAQLATRILSGQPKYRFRRMDGLTLPENLEAALKTIAWDNPVQGLQQAYARLGLLVTSPETSPATIDEVFRWLDAHQSPLTGWWVEGVHLEHKPDYLLTTFAVASVYALSYRELPRPELLARNIVRLQVRMGPMKGLFGSVDRPHLSEMCAAYLLFQLRPMVRSALVRDIDKAVARLCEAVDRFLSFAGPAAHTMDTSAGMLARLQTLVILSQMLPTYVRFTRPWKTLWQKPELLRNNVE